MSTLQWVGLQVGGIAGLALCVAVLLGLVYVAAIAGDWLCVQGRIWLARWRVRREWRREARQFWEARERRG